tara:strand:+ start:577 stop:1128 length:552 start_codon:yes stop_codon:yes gene_type:complete
MIIGLSGLARCGKDSFFSFAEKYFLEKGEQCKRFAFADELKRECEEFLLKNFSISPWTDEDEEKKIIRPLLVSYGMAKREISNGTYWVLKIQKQVEEFSNDKTHSVITDVRFKNEVDIINKLGGITIHITREGNEPPNEEERINDPIVKLNCKEIFCWQDFKNFPDEDTYKMVCEFLTKVGDG